MDSFSCKIRFKMKKWQQVEVSVGVGRQPVKPKIMLKFTKDESGELNRHLYLRKRFRLRVTPRVSSISLTFVIDLKSRSAMPENSDFYPQVMQRYISEPSFPGEHKEFIATLLRVFEEKLFSAREFDLFPVEMIVD